MSVISISITDQTFDKKSSEVCYLEHVIDLIRVSLRNSQGTSSAPTNVLGTSATGVPNSIVASFTYTASAAKA
jgi:hypothetical protein